MYIQAYIHTYVCACTYIRSRTRTPIHMCLLVWLQLNEALNSLFCPPVLSCTQDEPVATTRRNDREKVAAMQVSHVMHTYTHMYILHTYIHICMAVFVCVSSVWETKHMINELLILLGPNKGYDFPSRPSPCCHVIIIVVVPLPPPLGLRASAPPFSLSPIGHEASDKLHENENSARRACRAAIKCFGPNCAEKLQQGKTMTEKDGE